MAESKQEQFTQKSVLGKEVVYSGDRYTDPRTIEESMNSLELGFKKENSECVDQIRHIADAQKELAKSIGKTLTDETRALEYLKNIAVGLFTFRGGMALRNAKGLLKKIPGGNHLIDRSMAEVLIENLELAQARTRETGKYVKQVEGMLAKHADLIDFLHKKRIEVASNKDKAMEHAESLKKYVADLETQIKVLVDGSVERIAIESKFDAAQRELSETRTLLNLFQTAETRLETIVKLRKITRNNIESLKGGAYIVYQSAYEYLSEIEPLVQELAIASTGVETLAGTVRTVSGLKDNMLAVAQLVSDAALLVEKDLDKLVAEITEIPKESMDKLEAREKEIEAIRKQKYEEIKIDIENKRKALKAEEAVK